MEQIQKDSKGKTPSEEAVRYKGSSRKDPMRVHRRINIKHAHTYALTQKQNVETHFPLSSNIVSFILSCFPLPAVSSIPQQDINS